MKKSFAAGLLATAALVGGCATSATAPSAPAQPVIAPIAETEAAVGGDANGATLALSASGQAIVLGAAEGGGIEFYRLDGARAGAAPSPAAVGVDARHGMPRGAEGADSWVVAALDGGANRLRLYEFNAATGAARDLTARDINIGFAGESLCLYRDALDRNTYAFALGGDGQVAQFVLFGANGRLDAQLVRQINLASEVSYCVTDDSSGDLYLAEQAVGVWRFGANPEALVVPELIDAARLGQITEEVGGLAIYNAGAANYLISSDSSANAFHVYDRNADHRFVGSFQIGASQGGVDAVEAAGGLFASSMPQGARLPQGMLIATDDSNEGGINFKIVSWADVAGALNLAAGTPVDPRVEIASPIATVTASLETPPVETDGDAADDPAIWAHPTNPALSLIIGTQKQSGLYVYDLNGAVLQFLPDGRMNNVDVRYGFRLNGQSVSLVTSSNRTNDSISIYRVDPNARRLVNVADGVQPTGFADPYGLCMYNSARSGRSFVFVNDTEGGMKQWELLDAGNGRVRTNLVREFSFSSQTEGCVADDANGVLYVAEEDVGLWRLSAEPDGGDARTSVTTVAGNDAIKDDLEGIGLYALDATRGYLVLSSQGNNTYAVFRREGANEYVGSFAVVADGARGIDGSSETDGLEVSSANLGGIYGHGLFVAQDGRNVAPAENQNFKLVPWSSIARAMNLEER
jgi:3-phytase